MVKCFLLGTEILRRKKKNLLKTLICSREQRNHLEVHYIVIKIFPYLEPLVYTLGMELMITGQDS